MDWDEACNYWWRYSEGYDRFQIKREGNNIYWRLERENSSWRRLGDLPYSEIFLFSYKREGLLYIVGPMLPPVLMKIKQMEKRHKAYLEKKYGH